MNKDMILNTTTSSTSSDLQLCPASPDTREIFRPTIHFSDECGGNFRPITTVKPHQQNPRKKRSKMMRVQNVKPIVGGGDSSNKGKYGKKPEANGPKVSRPCSECGKSFWSWKALFGHMRCHPERPWRGINPPPNSYNNSTTNEDRYVASCLLMLAKGPTHYEELGECNKVFGGRNKNKKKVKGCSAKMRKEGQKRWHWERDQSEDDDDDVVVAATSVYRLDLNLNLNLNLPADAPSQDYSDLGLDLRLGL